MSDKNQMFTVNKVSQLTGVTIKTLHYYQKIGLLKPTKIGDNNYRYYSEEDIKKLQEILVYRTMGFSLSNIDEMLKNLKNDSRIERLKNQLVLIQNQMVDLKEVIMTIKKSIIAEEEKITMDKKEMFEGIKKEDDVFKSMQSLTILFSKFVSFIFLIVGIAAIYIYGKAFLDNKPLWVGEQGNTISFMFVIIGFALVLFSSYTLFFTKISDQLEIANRNKMKELKK